MAYCKYHPTRASLNYCRQCDVEVCGACTDKGDDGRDRNCFQCGAQMEQTGVPVDVEPFWRRIDKGLRYPLKTPVMVFIGVISFLSAVSSYLPGLIRVFADLALTGTLLRYCFNCLRNTALGNMEAVDITTAFQGGVQLYFRLMGVLLVVFAAAIAAFTFFGRTTGLVFMVLVVMALPAMIVMYAMSESIADTLNPVKLMQLVFGIGLPYGLILGIIFIMMASVEVIGAVIGYRDSVLMLTLQSFVSNYYAVAMFHLLGYMIYQYQDRLGYSAQAPDSVEVRGEAERQLTRLRILIKEGKWREGSDIAPQALKDHPASSALQSLNFRFTLATLPGAVQASRENPASLKEHRQALLDRARAVFDGYLQYLFESGQKRELRRSYLQIQALLKRYQPQRANVRYELANACFAAGDFKRTVVLLNGLHKSDPDFPFLASAYRLVAEALKALPGMEAKASKFEAFAAARDKKAGQKPAAATSAERAEATGNLPGTAGPSGKTAEDKSDGRPSYDSIDFET